MEQNEASYIDSRNVRTLDELDLWHLQSLTDIPKIGKEMGLDESMLWETTIAVCSPYVEHPHRIYVEVLDLMVRDELKRRKALRHAR